MASNNVHTTSQTETMIREAEEQIPHPTLRLKRDFQKECEEEKKRLMDKIRTALNSNIDELTTVLKSMVPKDPEDMKKFEEALPVIEALMEDQTSFNEELLNAVGDYLLEAWRKMKEGSSPEEMKKFKDERRRALSTEFDRKSQDIKNEFMETLVTNKERNGPKNQEE